MFAVWLVALTILQQCTVGNGHRRRNIEDKNMKLLFKSAPESYEDYLLEAQKPIPHWLQGQLFRNGPGQFEMGDRKVRHIYDAFCKITSFKLLGNRTVLYTSKFVGTGYYRTSKRLNTIAPYLMFDGADPPFSSVESMEALLHGIDNPITSIYQLGDNSADFVAVGDFYELYKLDKQSLETISKVEPELPGRSKVLSLLPLPLPSCGHPLQEHNAETFINFVSELSVVPFISNTISIVRIFNAKKREVISRFKVDRIPYMHSFGLTPTHVILFGAPMYISTYKILETISPSQSLDWVKTEPTTFYVIEIKTGNVQIMKTETIFGMHHVNSYHIKPHIINMDFITYPDLEFTKSMTLNIMLNKTVRDRLIPGSLLKRYRLNLRTNKVRVRKFPETPGKEYVNFLDVPAINEKYRFKKYCYIYGVALRADNHTLGSDHLVKKNICRRGKDKSWNKPGHFPTEPTFIADPNGTREDHGILLTVVLDGYREQSYLLMLNARSMRRVNKVIMPSTLPFVLHGHFYHQLYNKDNRTNLMQT